MPAGHTVSARSGARARCRPPVVPPAFAADAHFVPIVSAIPCGDTITARAPAGPRGRPPILPPAFAANPHRIRNRCEVRGRRVLKRLYACRGRGSAEPECKERDDGTDRRQSHERNSRAHEPSYRWRASSFRQRPRKPRTDAPIIAPDQSSYETRTAIPARAMWALASPIVASPKWKIEAASTALAWPSRTPATKWSSVPTPPLAITGT